MVAVESRALTPEGFQKATELRGKLDAVLIQDPEFLRQASEAVLHPRSNRDILGGGSHYNFQWTRQDGKHIVVNANNLEGEERFLVDVYFGQGCKRADIATDGKNARGSSRYSETHISGMTFRESHDDTKTTTGIEEIINDLEK